MEGGDSLELELGDDSLSEKGKTSDHRHGGRHRGEMLWDVSKAVGAVRMAAPNAVWVGGEAGGGGRESGNTKVWW